MRDPRRRAPAPQRVPAFTMMEAVVASGPPQAGKALPGANHCDACFSGHYPIVFQPGSVSSLRRVVN